MKNISTLLFIFCFAITSLAQSTEIKVRFIGNCGLHLSDGVNDLYVDFPYESGTHKYMTYPDSELDSLPDGAFFLFTHKHTDHYSKKAVKDLVKNHGAQVFDNQNADELDRLRAGLQDFSIQAFDTSHKFTFQHYSYLITWHGKRMFFSGDTGDTDVLNELNGVDWAFVNPWLWMNALEEKVKVDAKMVGIYHLYPNQKVNGEIPENLMILKNQGDIIQIR